jgi:hypothetical protein
MSQICCQLHQLFNHLPVLAFPFDTNKIPQNGIYILFEKGETGHGTNRIVRIGTHTGNNQLRSRLKQHFIQENKDRSIFRKNIGRALLNRDHDPFLAQWELDLTTREAKQKYKNVVDFSRQKQVEQQVTNYIQGIFCFIIFCVDEKEQRLDWESKVISAVSLCTECQPSINWLGEYSPIEKIRQSGLWNVNGLYKKSLSDSEYNAFEKVIIGKEQPNN